MSDVKFTIEVDAATGRAVVKGFGKDAVETFKNVEQASRQASSGTRSALESVKGSIASLRQHWLAVSAATTSAVTAMRASVLAFTRSALESVKSSIAGLRQHWLALTAATAGAVAAMKESVSAFMEAEAAENKLARALANTGQLSRESFESLSRYAAQVQETTGQSDDLAKAMMAQLLTFRSADRQIAMTSEQLKTALGAALDLAVGKEMSLEAAVELVGKAFAGKTETLARYGITISDSIPDSEKFAAVLEAIRTSVGPAAQAEMNTSAGQVRLMKEQWNDFMELVGGGVVKAIQFVIFQLKTIPAWIKELEISIHEFDIKVREILSRVFSTDSNKAPIAAARAELEKLKKERDAAEAAAIRAFNAINPPDKSQIYRNNANAIKGMGASAEEAENKLKTLNQILADARAVIATQHMNEYEKKLYEIKQRYAEQIEKIKELKLTTAEYNAAVAELDKAKQIELWQAENEEIERQNELLIKNINRRGEAAKKLDDLIKEYSSARVGKETVNLMSQEDIDYLRHAAETMNEDELEMTRQYFEEKYKMAKDHAEDEQRLWQEQQDAAQESFRSMAEFYRDALTQMASDTGSFVDMVKNKLKNLAASVAAQALTSVTMSVLRAVPGMQSAASFAGIPLHGTGQGAGSGLPGVPSITSLAANPWLAAGMTAGALGVGGYNAYSGIKAGSPLQAGLGGATLGFGALSVSGAIASGSISAGVANAAAAASALAPVAVAFLGIPAVIAAVWAVTEMMSNKAEQRRARRAKAYGKEFQRAAEYDVEKGSLADYMGGAESMLDKKSLYSFMKLGGISAQGSGELYRMIAFAKQYKQAIEETGEASAQTIGQYQRLMTEMKWFNATAAAWEGKAKGIAEGFKKIKENIEKLQLKAVMEDLEQGVGVFTYNLQKLEEIGLEGDALNKVKYEQTLKFLTDDAYPALRGELTKARETFKAAAVEMDKLSRAEEDAAIKAKILRSDLALTEQQLEAIRSGEVNSAMISLYTALGEFDKQLTIVIADGSEAQSIFEAMQQAGESLIGTLERLKEQFKNVDMPDSLREAYTVLNKTATAVQILGEAGQKIEDLPDTFEAIADAVRSGDLTALNTELLKLSDTLLYLSGVAEMANMSRLAASFAASGNLVAGLFLVIELAQLAGHWLENLLETAYETEIGKTWIDNLIEKLEESGRLAQWLAGWLKEAIAAPESVSGTLADALGMGKMSVQEAGSVYQRYRDEAKYGGMTDMGAQIAQIEDEAKQAMEAIGEAAKQVMTEALADGKVTAEELQQYVAAMNAAQEAMGVIWEGAQEKIQKLKDDWAAGMDEIIDTAGLTEAGRQMYQLNKWYEEQKKIVEEVGLSQEKLNAAYEAQRRAIIDSVMQPIGDVLATAGMSDYEKQVYNVNKQVDQWILSLREAGASVEEIAQAEQARGVMLEQLAEQQQKQVEQWRQNLNDIIATAGMDDLQKQLYTLNRWYQDQAEQARELGESLSRVNAAYAVQRKQIIDSFFDPILEDIRAKIRTIETSAYNVFANPQEMGQNLAAQFQEALSAMRGAQGAETGAAYQRLSQAADQYLAHMLETYRSGQEYQDAYREVMAALREAEARVAGEKTAYMSEYEVQSLQKLDALAAMPQQLADALSDMSGFEELKDSIDNGLVVQQQATNDTLAVFDGKIDWLNASLWALNERAIGIENGLLLHLPELPKIATSTANIDSNTKKIDTNFAAVISKLEEVKKAADSQRLANRIADAIADAAKKASKNR